MKIILYNNPLLLKDYACTQKIVLPEIDRYHFSAKDRMKFTKDYLNLIGELSARNHGRLWWATDIASKNRFKSKLVERCQEIVEILTQINKQSTASILAYPCSSAVAAVIKKRFTGADLEIIDLTVKKNFEIVRLRKIFGLCWLAATIVGRIIKAKWVLGHFLNALDTSKKYYVIKTFLYDHSFDQQGVFKDIFFGPLPTKMAESRDVCIIAFVLGRYNAALENIKRSSQRNIFLIENFLTIKDVVMAVKDILFYRSTLGKGYKFGEVNVDDVIQEEYQRQFKGIQIYQLLHYAALCNLAKTITMTHYLQTYENNPWEKMCLWAIKEKAPQVQTIGYQHTVVPQASMNMFPSTLEQEIMPLPDKILTVGQVNQDIMERYGVYQKGQVLASCALRFEYLQRLTIAPRPKLIKKILLAIEGVFEAHEMVEFVIAQLANHPDFEVLVRTHPTLPWSAFETKFQYQLNKISNFKISHGTSLKEDLSNNNVVIYWGSTVGIESIAMGIPAINFMTKSIVNFDPLFDSNAFKWVVTSDDSLVACLRSINDLTDVQYQEKQEQGLAHMRQYLYPVTNEAMRLFL